MASGLDIAALFDNDFYLFENPDVANAVKSGAFSDGLEHFLKFGQFENRDPNPFFDTSFYLESNPDVKAAVDGDPRDELTGIEHFIKFGQFEERDPSPDFDTNFYLDNNPEAKAAVERDELTGLEHFIKIGQFERLQTAPRLVQNELYFGRDIGGTGMVSEEQFQQFLDTAITPRFTDGLTVYNANGQYLNSQGQLIIEPSKVVVLIAENTSETEQRIAEIIDSYKQQFQQETVLRVTSTINVDFA